MKNLIKSALFVFVLVGLGACTTSKVSFEDIQKKVYSNNFSFIAAQYENTLTFSAPEGTGRLAATNTQAQPENEIGIKVSQEKLVINLPINEKELGANKYSVKTVSEDFTVVRKNLENGNILVNYFLNDQKDINLIKMEVGKDGKIDCSVEGQQLKPMLYEGYLKV